MEKSLAEAFREIDSGFAYGLDKVREDNRDIIEKFLKKYKGQLKYDLKTEDDLYEHFTDLYVYPDFQEKTFRLVATMHKKEGHAKGKPNQLFHLGVRLKREMVIKHGEAAAFAIIRDKMLEFITFTYAFKIQQKFREIDELNQMTIELQEEASKFI